MKKLRAYSLTNRHGNVDPCAFLVFAHTAREAKKVGWASDGCVMDMCDGEWPQLAATWIRESFIMEEADKEKLAKNEAHYVMNPRSCDACELWGQEMSTDTLCIDCEEE